MGLLLKQSCDVNKSFDISKIAITGKARSGKDALAKYLIKKYGYTRYAFADELKHYFHEILGDTNEKPREGYIWFGQTMRERDPYVWINKLFEKVGRENPAKIVITDCRQPNEFERLRKEGFLIIRITSYLETRVKRMEQEGDKFSKKDLTHETETHLDQFPVHFELYNNGSIEDLYENFEKVISVRHPY